ncbi:MAG: response regulator [Bacteroidota bacterium]|jgi:DNA-binding NarL/FixJ family response regulator
MSTKIKIVIADDHVLIAETWATLINLDPAYQVIKVYDNTQSLLDEVADLQPQIVILDINIAPISGLDAVKVIREKSPNSRTIGVSMHNQPSFAKRMISNGAMGYVTKNSTKDEMYKAINEVMEGKIYICAEIKNRITQNILLEDDESARLNSLTDREIDIIKLLKEGCTNEEIAKKLFLSPRTVDTHRAKILKKLQLKNSLSLIKLINERFPDL